MTALMRERASQTVAPGCDSAGAETLRLAGVAPRPTALAETGLSLTFLADLLAKHLATAGVLATSQLMERLALSGPILGPILNFLRTEGRVEVRSRLGHDAELRYGLTEKGSVEAAAALGRSGYVGPAPVPLADYVAVVGKQSVHARAVTREAVHRVFDGIVVSHELLDCLGPALNSHRAILMYGLAGTGKTFIARRSAGALQGLVLVPHAIAVGDAVVEVFDPICHKRVPLLDSPDPTRLEEGYDPRYVPCERPVVFTGGELSADMLEVQCDAVTRTFSAPIQLKANNGFLLIDDLGRQRVDPVVLFNRWIVPMDSRRDSLTAGNGQHFEVPFDLMLVLSTNLQPADIADEAFLRRLGYKIEFKPIAAQEYRRIWQQVCSERRLKFDPRLVDFAINELHGTDGTPLLPCQPRDLLGMALDRIAYLGGGELDETALRWAWDNYFLHKTSNEYRTTGSTRSGANVQS